MVRCVGCGQVSAETVKYSSRHTHPTGRVLVAAPRGQDSAGGGVVLRRKGSGGRGRVLCEGQLSGGAVCTSALSGLGSHLGAAGARLRVEELRLVPAAFRHLVERNTSLITDPGFAVPSVYSAIVALGSQGA
ncbi:hypothetical protein E2C01_102125 [Portunus trituberculatus]|uniref:Uncharacterized protein n=1 Tax=Portunus trituberculatus TaxID=210409 RepID=A0A5B7KGJ0_PORTR|nr:hypothetical protein [Portunus trituberculatus]